MCSDVDCLHRSSMQESIYDSERRKSWTPSQSSSMTNKRTSWFERALLIHLKRLFQRKSSSNIACQLITPSEDIPSLSSIPDQSVETESFCCEPIVDVAEPEPCRKSPPIDSLYDYENLLTRCYDRYENERDELLRRHATPISIPHADLIIVSSRSILINWKSYLKLFRSLGRRADLFEKYLQQFYRCQTSINEREQLVLPVRTSQNSFDLLLRKYLDDYVTCLTCQTAQTHLIKYQGQWRIECRLCGCQRKVPRLK